jgi:hypothetical protein
MASNVPDIVLKRMRAESAKNDRLSPPFGVFAADLQSASYTLWDHDKDAFTLTLRPRKSYPFGDAVPVYFELTHNGTGAAVNCSYYAPWSPGMMLERIARDFEEALQAPVHFPADERRTYSTDKVVIQFSSK